MKLEDIIALAKQGYKKADIEELINLAKETEKEPEPVSTEEEVPEGGSSEPVNAPEDVKVPEPEPDYKMLYEQSQATIKQMQQNNVTKNLGGSAGDPSDSEILNEIVRSFM